MVDAAAVEHVGIRRDVPGADDSGKRFGKRFRHGLGLSQRRGALIGQGEECPERDEAVRLAGQIVGELW
nr:hypothetical protein CPGR_05680 [Mycolicibacter nonchromogenicus]